MTIHPDTSKSLEKLLLQQPYRYQDSWSLPIRRALLLQTSSLKELPKPKYKAISKGPRRATRTVRRLEGPHEKVSEVTVLVQPQEEETEARPHWCVQFLSKDSSDSCSL